MIVARLAAIGYTVQENDATYIEFIQNSISQSIKNFCNTNKIPMGLTYVYINAICGEFLYQKKSVGGLGDTFDFSKGVSAAISAIKEGDTQVTLKTDASPEAQFDSLINSMRTLDYSAMVKYRKLVW